MSDDIELCLNCNRPRSVHSAIFGECGGGRSPKYTFRSKSNGMAAARPVGVPNDRRPVSQAVVGVQATAEQEGCEVVDVAELAELRRKAAAYDAGVQAWGVKSGDKLKLSIKPDREDAEDAAEFYAMWRGVEAKVVPVRIVEVSDE